MYHNRDEIILASGSPRRRQYLLELGLSFTVRAASVDEHPFSNEKPEEFVQRMAREKAAVVCAESSDAWVISGDTIVCLGEKILGKPTDAKNAVDILMELSGREHYVKTGFCVAHGNRRINQVQVVSTKVCLSNFPESVARAYVATGECMDKAGAYGIQGKGIFLIQSIQGSYSNVVGLPVYELLEVLRKNGVITPDSTAQLS